MFTIIFWIVSVCFIVSITCLSKNDSWWKWFVPFLAFTSLVEGTGYFLYFIQHKQNHWLFNVFLPIEISFIFYILYKICSQLKDLKTFFSFVTIIFLSIYLIESIDSDWLEYSKFANIFASCMIIIICFFFYFLLMKQTDVVDIWHHSPFWIISGLFIFYLGSIGCNLFGTQLSHIYFITQVPIRYIIMIILNFIFYTCWSYAFVCKYRYKISSS